MTTEKVVSETSLPERRHERRASRDGIDVSVVIPLLNEEESLQELHDRIVAEFERGKWNGEIVFVDDGSSDSSFRVIETLAERDSRVRSIKFRRNFGKAAALSAGFAAAAGDFVITMDADLQDDPKEIPRLIAKLQEGFDVVSGWKKVRHDPITKTLPSKLFNAVTSFFTGISLHDFNCGLKGYRKAAVKELDLYGELHRYIPALAGWKGFRVTEIEVTHHARQFGTSKYGPARFLNGFLDLMTVMLLTRFTLKPLHLFGMLGAILGTGGFVICAFLVSLKLQFGNIQGRNPLLLLGVLLIITGFQFVSTGLLAEMIASQRGERARDFSVERTIGL